ncbi:unnamed protein product, partial [Symbiodinium pilosum]
LIVRREFFLEQGYRIRLINLGVALASSEPSLSLSVATNVIMTDFFYYLSPDDAVENVTLDTFWMIRRPNLTSAVQTLSRLSRLDNKLFLEELPNDFGTAALTLELQAVFWCLRGGFQSTPEQEEAKLRPQLAPGWWMMRRPTCIANR